MHQKSDCILGSFASDRTHPNFTQDWYPLPSTLGSHAKHNYSIASLEAEIAHQLIIKGGGGGA